MITINRQGDTDQYDIISYTVDSLSDIASLPTNAAMGSICICIENSSVWMLGGDKIWHEI